MEYFHTVIIGGGASGLFCAGSFDARKLVLDHNTRPGAKVSISGGGKCNFSNLHLSAQDYLCTQKHFPKNALAAFTPTDFTTLLDTAHIPYAEREEGQLFAQSAHEIVQFLVTRAKRRHTNFRLDTQSLSVQKTDTGFVVQTSKGPVGAQQVVLACGGLSYPALGASPFGKKVAQQFGLSFVEQRPALCGLTLPKNIRPSFALLAGNSTPVTVHTGKYSFNGSLLFTHEGVSGPAVLQTSLFWQPQEPVKIDFLPGTDALQFFYQHKNETRPISRVLAEKLPPKITKTLLGALDKPLCDISKNDLQSAAASLNHFTFIPQGTAGYTKAEVTAGGVDTAEINPHTFECKKVKGLYIIGELLDVTGRLGGFNLHWAWASAYACAQALQKIP